MTTDGETWGRRYNEAARDLMLCESKLRDAEAEVRALTARLDTAHTVIRRRFNGWERGTAPDGAPMWFDVYAELTPVPITPAEAAEIRAATADPTPQTDGDHD